MSHSIPITILTGPLGSGKTTLVNRLLTAQHGLRIAAVINEFGEIGIDGDLVLNVEGDEVYTLSNGCICCSVREDLIEVVEGLVYGNGTFDRIVIETTGLAEPGPVVMGLLNHPEVEERFRLDGVVTVIDARTLALNQGTNADTLLHVQLAYADRILLNKIDLVDAATAERLEQEIRSINPLAPIERTLHATTDIHELLDIGGFSGGGAIEALAAQALPPSAHLHHHTRDAITSVSLRFTGTIDRERFNAWIAPLLAERHRDIIRMKGILHTADAPAPLVVQGVHGLYTWQYMQLRTTITDNRLVVIGRNINPEELERRVLSFTC